MLKEWRNVGGSLISLELMKEKVGEIWEFGKDKLGSDRKDFGRLGVDLNVCKTGCRGFERSFEQFGRLEMSFEGLRGVLRVQE